MEDTICLKHHYLYMFRWDSKKNDETLEFMLKKFAEYNINNWIGKHEISENGKPHYQMAVWSEHKLDSTTKTKVRNCFNRSKLTSKTAQPCSFTDGRKIKSLIAYSTKDESAAIVQLPQHALKAIPKWKNKSAEKIIFQEKLREFIINLNKPYLETPYEYCDKKDAIDKIVQFHIDNDIQPPSKGRMLYYLVKYHFISVSDYRAEVYNFRMFNDNNY